MDETDGRDSDVNSALTEECNTDWKWSNNIPGRLHGRERYQHLQFCAAIYPRPRPKHRAIRHHGW